MEKGLKPTDEIIMVGHGKDAFPCITFDEQFYRSKMLRREESDGSVNIMIQNYVNDERYYEKYHYTKESYDFAIVMINPFLFIEDSEYCTDRGYAYVYTDNFGMTICVFGDLDKRIIDAGCDHKISSKFYRWRLDTECPTIKMYFDGLDEQQLRYIRGADTISAEARAKDGDELLESNNNEFIMVGKGDTFPNLNADPFLDTLFTYNSAIDHHTESEKIQKFITNHKMKNTCDFALIAVNPDFFNFGEDDKMPLTSGICFIVIDKYGMKKCIIGTDKDKRILDAMKNRDSSFKFFTWKAPDSDKVPLIIKFTPMELDKPYWMDKTDADGIIPKPIKKLLDEGLFDIKGEEL